MSSKKGALFICLGNICRSPIAEAVFKEIVSVKGVKDQWNVDSAATSTYQIGNPPDSRGRECMESHHVYQHVKHHRARQVTESDYQTFDYIFGMDDSNMKDLEHMAPKRKYKARLLKLGLHDPEKSHGGTIQDPYYSQDSRDFEQVYQQCYRSCLNFLECLEE